MGRDICPATVLRDVSVQHRAIGDFHPVADSLEWRLAQAGWIARGVSGFIDDSVPWAVNNDGRLSADAAAVLLANCRESPPGPDGFTLLELGAGTGLFARYLLDEFQALSLRGSHDFYERLTYVVTDRSPATVEFWATRGIFDRHGGHVRLQVADALAPASVACGPLRAAFCNYILDTLPADTFRRTATGWERLNVRAWLCADDALPQACALGTDEIRARVHAGDLQALVPVLPLLEGERRFFPASGDVPAELETAGPYEVGQPVVFNHGALTCVRALVALLQPGGFVLVNDYGVTRAETSAELGPVQWFGTAAATGLNFPLLELCCGANACTPDGDDELAVHARLLLRDASPATRQEFADRFALTARRRADVLVERARAAVASGDWQQALAAFQAAIEQNPRNWLLIGEAADFVAAQLRAYPDAMALAEAALALNPWYSPWLWNLRGRLLASAGRGAEAHESHLRAEQVAPEDPATQLHLAGSFLERGNPGRSLRAVAVGLAHDSRSQFRHALLEKQQAAIGALQLRWARENEAASRRQVAGLPGPAPTT